MPSKNAWGKLVDLNSDKSVVYFFSSKDCPFCTRAKPYIDVLAEKYKDSNLHVETVDVSEQKDIAEYAAVEEWPQYIFVDHGEVVSRDKGWEEGQRIWLEERLGIDKKYGLRAGLALSQEEMDAILEDPNSQVGINREVDQKVSGCGDSTQQVAEIAAGMQEALDKIDNKLRSIMARLDAIESRFAPLYDDFIQKPQHECKCGKHKKG